MHLTPAQTQTLRTAILAETDPTFVGYRANGQTDRMAEWLNQPSPFVVWKTSVPTGDLFDAITWSNLTPSPAPDGSAAWTNRSLACQGKQFNLQTMLTGRDTLNPSRQRIRNGLQDALSDVPSGNNGNFRQAGWTEVLALLHRAAGRFEALYANGTGTIADPGLLRVEGLVEGADISAALAQ